MQVNDPFELTLPPSLKSDVEYEEPRDYHEFFWDDQQTGSQRFAEDDPGFYSQVCVFEDGEHVVMARDCPHFNSEDEEGKLIKRGWTVQQRT